MKLSPRDLPRLLARGALRLPTPLRRQLNGWRGIAHARLVDLPPGRVVLVVAPHPDDELLGIGATLAKHRAADHDVHVVFVTSGEASIGVRGGSDGAVVREEEATAAAQAAIPGATLHFLRIPDGAVGAHVHGVRAALSSWIDEIRPDLVYAPHPGETHPDHVAVSDAVTDIITSARPCGVEHVAWYEVWTPIAATHLVDVTAEYERKAAGLACYRSQLGVIDYLRAAEGLAAYRSAHALGGRGYAEAFVLMTPAELAVAPTGSAMTRGLS